MPRVTRAAALGSAQSLWPLVLGSLGLMGACLCHMCCVCGRSAVRGFETVR